MKAKQTESVRIFKNGTYSYLKQKKMINKISSIFRKTISYLKKILISFNTKD